MDCVRPVVADDPGSNPLVGRFGEVSTILRFEIPAKKAAQAGDGGSDDAVDVKGVC